MRYRRLRLSATTLMLVLLVVAFGIGGSTVPTSSDREQISDSVAYLVHTYRVSAAEAVRRLRLSADSAALERHLAGSLSGEYAGMWLDQHHGGVLMVATTSIGHAEQVVRGLPHRDEIRLIPVPHSLRDLTTIRDQVQAQVGGIADAQVDVLHNRVEVWTDHPNQVARTLSGIVWRRSGSAQAVAIRLSPPVTPTACRPLSCGPPMRGGISVDLGDAHRRPLGTYCTSGFNLRDTAGRFYATTAGHCFVLRPTAQYLLNPKDDSVISKRNDTRAVIVDERSPRVDFAVMPIVHPEKWMPDDKRRNSVYYECSIEPMPNPCNGPKRSRFRITGMKDYSAMMIGEVVCMAGASPMTAAVKPGTRCGQITAKPDGAIQTNICAKLGDSGSPLFDQVTHTAYGLESGLVDGSVYGRCAPFGEQKTLYTPLSVILDRASRATGITYSLITHRDG